MALNLPKKINYPTIFKTSKTIGPGVDGNIPQQIINNDQLTNGNSSGIVYTTGLVWSDITGATITFELDVDRDILVLGNTQMDLGADLATPGGGIRINVDGTENSNSQRIVRYNFYAHVEPHVDVLSGRNGSVQDSIILSTQTVVSLAAGTHTIKLQVIDFQDGAEIPAGKANISLIVGNKSN